MLSKLGPYPQMKDTEIPWLGTIPHHWHLVPNRALMKFRKALVGKNHDQYTLLSLTKNGVIVRDISTGRGKFSADLGTSQLVRRGDLIFCLFDIPETPRTVGLANNDGMITSAYSVFRCVNPDLAKFLELYYCALDDRKLLSPLYTGLRNTIPASRFLGVKSPMPPPEEQIEIIRFLDHADRKIRRYIRAKQKLIKLLEEQKQAIIHRAVTRGLDPDITLKPSGIDWLGDIPIHWRLIRLRHLVIGKLAYGANAAAEYNNPGWPRFLRITDFSGEGTLKTSTFRSLPFDVAVDYMVEPGDILLARSGATVGKAFIVPDDLGAACFAGYLIRARTNRELLMPEFLFLYSQSRSFNEWRSITLNTATIPNIGADKYADLPVPIPPVSEQAAILEYLRDELDQINTLRATTTQQIALLRECRTTLVSDVVTGKIDVREAAASLPEELDAALDEISDIEDADADDTLDGATEPIDPEA